MNIYNLTLGVISTILGLVIILKNKHFKINNEVVGFKSRKNLFMLGLVIFIFGIFKTIKTIEEIY